jgi:hypothetical protein
VNWLAIGVSVVTVFVMSSVYYSVFGGALTGGAGRPAPWQVAAELGRSALVTIVLAGLADRLGLGFGATLVLAVVLWVAFPFVLLTGSVMWDGVAWRIAATHAGDWLLKLLAIAAIVGGWR